MNALEKAARAAWEENRRRAVLVDVDLPPWEEDMMALREDWIAVTRAVLMAVREPGGAWFQAHEDSGLTGCDAVAVRYFIDAILNEEPK